jgi:hypothetical protein
MAQDSPAEE